MLDSASNFLHPTLGIESTNIAVRVSYGSIKCARQLPIFLLLHSSAVKSRQNNFTSIKRARIAKTAFLEA